MTTGFALPPRLVTVPDDTGRAGHCILITGATGSLGSHMVAHYANLATVSSVICLNRRNKASGLDPLSRQLTSLTSRALTLPPEAATKLSVFEVDITKPHFGLPSPTFDSLVSSVTHIVHNAWPMNAKQPFPAFTSQFRVLRNLIDLAALISAHHPSSSKSKVGFQFISSIAVVGHYPLHENTPHVPEARHHRARPPQRLRRRQIRLRAHARLNTGTAPFPIQCHGRAPRPGRWVLHLRVLERE